MQISYGEGEAKLQRSLLKTKTVLLVFLAFCLVSIAPLSTVVARNNMQHYNGIVVMAVDDSQDVVQTAKAISSFDFGVNMPTTTISISSFQGIQTVLERTTGYLAIVGHGSPYGIETKEGVLSWMVVRNLIEISPAKAIIVTSCYSTMLGTFYDRTGVYGFYGSVDKDVASLATIGMLLREVGNDGKAKEVVNRLFQQDILQKAFYPENPLQYSVIGSTYEYGYVNGWLKAYLEVRKDTGETDPSWDYYFAVLRLQDVRWQNDFFTSPYIAEATMEFRYYTSGEVITDHSPTSGVNTLGGTSLNVFGWRLGVPAGFTTYTESDDVGTYKKAWWHQEGGFSIFGVWFIFEDSADFAMTFRMAQGSHGQVWAWGSIYWYTWAIFIFYYQGWDRSAWLQVNW